MRLRSGPEIETTVGNRLGTQATRNASNDDLHLSDQRSTSARSQLIDERTMGDYKTEKEAFHADNPGSSVHLINAISLVSLVS